MRRRRGGSSGWRIEWDTSSLDRGFPLMEIRIRRNMHAHVVLWATIIESYMKIRAPWTDRTGLARFTLAAQGVRENQNRYTIILRHGMKYGKWLEIANQRRYSIVLPTMYTHGHQVVANFAGMLDRIGV